MQVAILEALVEHEVTPHDVALTFVNYRIKQLKSQLISAIKMANDARTVAESLTLIPNMKKYVSGVPISSIAEATELRAKTYKTLYLISSEIDWLYMSRSVGIDFDSLCERYGIKEVIATFVNVKTNAIDALVNRYMATIKFWEKELAISAELGQAYPLIDKDGNISSAEAIKSFITEMSDRRHRLSGFKTSIYALKEKLSEQR